MPPLTQVSGFQENISQVTVNMLQANHYHDNKWAGTTRVQSVVLTAMSGFSWPG